MSGLGRFRADLLGTTLPVIRRAPTMTNTVTPPEPVKPLTLEAVKAACDSIFGGPRPRWAGGSYCGIAIEADPAMPSGWFGLRMPEEAAPYAGPLPMNSFGIFYRGGDVVRLSPRDAERLAVEAGAPRPDQGGQNGGGR